MSSEDRTYSEEEVDEILRKAVEGETTKAPAGSDGMSLTELKDIGADASRAGPGSSRNSTECWNGARMGT